MSKKGIKPVIEGIIIPSNWDDRGVIKGVSLFTPNEQEYRVQLNKLGKELLNLIHQKIEAKGKIRERLDGSRHIILSSYRKLNHKHEIT